MKVNGNMCVDGSMNVDGIVDPGALAKNPRQRRYFLMDGGDDAFDTTEEPVGSLNALPVPGDPDGVRQYRVRIFIGLDENTLGSTRQCIIRLYVGDSGDGTGTDVQKREWTTEIGPNYRHCNIVGQTVITPAADDLFGLTVRTDVGSSVSVNGGTTEAQYSYVEIEEVT